MTSTVLIVDDETTILNALSRLFVDDTEISVVTAGDGESALSILSEHSIDLIVSDLRMQGMTGAELLAKARQLYPDIPRMLLTGDSTFTPEDAAEAVGERVPIVYKPWDTDELRQAMSDALTLARLDEDERILIQIGGISVTQLERARRIRDRMQKDRAVGEILVELGDIPQAAYDRVVQIKRSRMTVPEILREQGHLDEEGLESYKQARAERPDAADLELLVDEERVTEEQYLRAVCCRHEVPFVEPEVGLVDAELLERTSFRYISVHHVIPVRVLNSRMSCIVSDPLDTCLVAEMERIFGVPVDVSCSTRAKIREALQTLERLKGGDEGIRSAVQYHELADMTDEQETGEEAVQIVDYLLVRAIQLEASDLHIEPLQERIRVRLRVDGVLQQLTDLPIEFCPRIVSRVKILASADITEKRLHQDGRIFVKVAGREVDIRLSTYASQNGETIVMRLLDRNRGLLPLDKCGFTPSAMESLDEIVLEASSGLVLITGPTGSGKTTTLYSFVAHANDPTEKVITCEDPVEIVLDGAIQCSVNQQIGPTFEDSLRAILRQDPDTIVVGEIRDKTTVSLALEAALTGHKVFSTFHTEDAVGAVVRLLEMGTEPFLVSSTISTIIAQRLVRRLCSRCRRPAEPSRAEMRFLGLQRPDFKGYQVWESGGCAACGGTGYKGRVGIHEVLIPDDDFRDIIVHKRPAKEMRAEARKLEEFLTLQEDGLLKALEGETTLNEVINNAPRDTGTRPPTKLRQIAKIGRK